MGAREFLKYAKNLGKPIIPILGLRYYTGVGPNYLNKFVDAAFFKTMLSVVADPVYGVESVIYWDSSIFGGPGYSTDGTKYANDGSDIWSASFPWLTATSEFFNIKIDPKLIDPKVELILKSGLLEF